MNSKADVVLVKLEVDPRSHYLAPPFGILYLASALEKEGFRVKLYHEVGTPGKIKSVVDEIVRQKPLFAGFSTLTGHTLVPTLAASKRLKKSSDIPVVWGGLHATMLPEQTLKSDGIDMVVIGEGEETVTELAKTLRGDAGSPSSLADIPGLAFKKDGACRTNPRRDFIRNLDAYSPAWHHLPIERYFYKGKYFFSDFGSIVAGDRIAALVTSRGCPWRCSYCYNQFVNKRSFRAHSAGKVIQDLERLRKDYNVSAVVFEDDNFFSDRERALEIIRNIRVPWSSSMRADNVAKWGDGFLEELRRHNCVELRIGGESGSQETLDRMHKDMKVEDVLRTVELCRKHKIRAGFNFMVGIPGESWPQMLETFRFMDELEKMGDGVAVKGLTTFLPWPGTPMYESAVAMGFRPPKLVEDWGIQYGPRQPRTPFTDRRARFAGHYRAMASREQKGRTFGLVFMKPLKYLAKKRWEKRFFRFPVDYYLPRLFKRALQVVGFDRIVRKLRA